MHQVQALHMHVNPLIDMIHGGVALLHNQLNKYDRLLC